MINQEAENYHGRGFTFSISDRGMAFAFRKLSINGVTLHSVVAKVFERIVYDQLYAYLEEQSIICKYKSGFRATYSNVTVLLEATDT